MEKPIQQNKEKKDKVKISGRRDETSWTRTILFLILFFVISIFMLQKWYFIDPEKDYNEVDSVVPEMKKKTSAVRDFDLNVFESEKYEQLQEDTWHDFKEEELSKGNRNPFRRIGFEE